MATQPIVESKTIGEYETTITIDAFQTTTRIAALPNNTLAVATIYIYNTQDLPTNSPDTVDLVVTDWTNGNVSTFELNQFKYGKYIENYPISIITISNNYPVAVQIYVQYIVKTYNPYLSPLIQDFTQLELVPTIIAQGYTGGTNFRFYNSLSNISFSGFSIGDLFYILDQQVLGTSATSTGYVTVQWTSVYTLNIGVSALGTAEDSTSYVFNVDSTTQALPSSATQSKATMNWVVMDFYSSMTISSTPSTIVLTYNTTTNTWEGTATQTISAYAAKLTSIPAQLAVISLN